MRFGTLLLAAVLTAACTSKPSTDDQPTPSPIEPDPPTVAPANATSCSRIFPAMFVDRAHAQTFLPKGFTAAEASGFFGQPSRPLGRAVFVVSMARCASSEWAPDDAMAGIFVEAPNVPGLDAKREHFYELGRVFNAGPAAANLSRLGWPRLGSEIETNQARPPTPSASGTIRDANGTVFRAATPAAPTQDPYNPTYSLRWWHQNARGVGFHDYTLKPDGYLGGGTCEARAGSMVARVMASTTCQGNVLFMVGPPFDVVGRFEWHPGLAATP